MTARVPRSPSRAAWGSATGSVIHRAQLPADEITTHDRIPVTSAARTLLDLAAVPTPQQLERAATEAEIRRLGSPTSLADLVARYPRRPGTPAIRRLLERHDIGRNITKRELELRFLAFLDDNLLPRPRINHEADGKQVDCLWPEQRLIAELDGFATHGTRRAFDDDRTRDRALVVAGYRVVRITWRQLDGFLAAQLRRLLEQRTAA
jgi:very-short-patch-repair endonuclease